MSKKPRKRSKKSELFQMIKIQQIQTNQCNSNEHEVLKFNQLLIQYSKQTQKNIENPKFVKNQRNQNKKSPFNKQLVKIQQKQPQQYQIYRKLYLNKDSSTAQNPKRTLRPRIQQQIVKNQQNDENKWIKSKNAPYNIFQMQEADSSDWQGDQCYVVQKIIDMKEQNNKTFYLVKWKGWDIKTSTWEPQQNVQHLKDLIKNFRNSRKQDLQTNLGSKKLSQAKADMNPYIATRHYGHVLYGDSPKCVHKIQAIHKNNKSTVHFEIQWNPRQNGLQPQNSMIDCDTLSQHYPQFVVDFYESKIRLMNTNK